jgi:hypothetical protein
MNTWIAISQILIVNIMFFLGVMIVIGLPIIMLIMPLFGWLSGSKVSGADTTSHPPVESVKETAKTVIPKDKEASQEQFVGIDRRRSSQG